MKAIVKAARTAGRKDALPSSMGFDRGFRPLAGYGSPGSPAQALKAINTYGGTEQSSATVFACVTLIAETLAGYEYGITDPEGDELQPTAADESLFALLAEPWPEATYNDFAGDVQTDLELVGNSYWLKDNVNGFLQPDSLKRLDPANITIQTNKQDEKIGYRYRVKGLEIPFGLEDIIHYKMRNPLSPHYGMGTVEALLREIEADLAQNAHVTAFFTNGARIAGVLTIPDGMDEIQFERLKDELAAEYGDPRNAYKMLIAEKATDFKSITTDPKAAGVVELRRLAKDDILKGFGVPEFMLGGIAQGGIQKMEQSQFVFYRKMVTKAQKFQDRTSISLASLWEGRKFVLFPEQNEPPEQKINNAKGLAEACASPNEVRVAAGLPEIDDERMDMPLLPTALSPLGIVFQGGAVAQNDPSQQTPPGKDADHPFAGIKAPRRSTRRRRRVHPDLKLPPGVPPQVALNPHVIQAMTRAVLSGEGGVVDSTATDITELPALPPGEQAAAEILGVVEQAERQLVPATRPQAVTRGAGDPSGPAPTSLAGLMHLAAEEPIKLLIEAPELPEGYEQRAPLIDPGEADIVQAQQLLQGQAQFFFRATPVMYSAFVTFFNDQRMRVLRRMDDFRSAHARAKYAEWSKALERESLWNDEVEREALTATYLEVVDRLGEDALAVPKRIVSAEIAWDLEHEYAKEAREALAEQVVRINETTRSSIADIVEEGVRRGYSIPRIANGYPDEGYKGIQGVFNEASAVRSETIARTETANLFNRSAVASYKTAGVGYVIVIDGTGDDVCAAANGSVWDLVQAGMDPLGHPNCVRCFAPKVEEEG